MAEMTIRLLWDRETGKRNIVVSLTSDEDALPHEHEQLHRQLVDKLIEQGTLKASEVGEVIVEREEEEKAPAAPVQSGEEDQRRAESEGN